MKNLKLIYLAVLGGMEVMFRIVSPALLSILTILYFNLGSVSKILILVVGLSSMLFRGIKIGFPEAFK